MAVSLRGSLRASWVSLDDKNITWPPRPYIAPSKDTRVRVEGMAPVVAVPTTSGTGSEVGRAAVITDPREHTKKIIFHPRMLPAIVIADPELTLGLPAAITAAVGMDALSHNLEAFCSPAYHPMAQGIALEGIWGGVRGPIGTPRSSFTFASSIVGFAFGSRR